MGWSVSFAIYINRPVEWGMTDSNFLGPINEDVYVGPGGYFTTPEEAVENGQGCRSQVKVSEGDYLNIVVIDEKGAYADNRGYLYILVTKLR